MRAIGFGLLALISVAMPYSLRAEDAAATPTQHTAPGGGPSWAPGTLVPAGAKEPEGRYHARGALMSFTLPESWRGPDVVVRELLGADAAALQPAAEAAVVIDYQPANGKPQTLVTIYRIPLTEWRKLEDAKTADFGRMTMNTTTTAYVVHRAADATAEDRYAELRDELEDMLITLAVYDPAVAVAAMRRAIAENYGGSLPDGKPIKIDLVPGGTMSMTWGSPAHTVKGQWMQRNNQVIMLPMMDAKTGGSSILMHFDNETLVVVTWDVKAFGPTGARLEAIH